MAHPRSAQYMQARKKQIPMCSLQPWACSQVKVLPRQWMVGPSSNSRLRPGETLVGASSAVNGRACRWPQAAGGDWSAALDSVQAATFRTDCRPESASVSETSEKGVLKQPSRDRNVQVSVLTIDTNSVPAFTRCATNMLNAERGVRWGKGGRLKPTTPFPTPRPRYCGKPPRPTSSAWG